MLSRAKLIELSNAALALGREGRLYDPSDDDVLIYSAESIGDTTTDLAKLEPDERRTIISHYDQGTTPLG